MHIITFIINVPCKAEQSFGEEGAVIKAEEVDAAATKKARILRKVFIMENSADWNGPKRIYVKRKCEREDIPRFAVFPRWFG